MESPDRPLVFGFLKGYRNVIVTGPHRSGTTICAEMISADTGLRVVREERFACGSEEGIRRCLAEGNCVLQCPMGFDLMPKLTAPDIAIVCMRRDLQELEDSRNRMWFRARRRLSNKEQNVHSLNRMKQAGLVGEKLDPAKHDAAELKYKVWDRWMREGVLHAPFEIRYEQLKAHPLWVPPEVRRKLGRNWHHRRTAVDETTTTAGWHAGDPQSQRTPRKGTRDRPVVS